MRQLTFLRALRCGAAIWVTCVISMGAAQQQPASTVWSGVYTEIQAYRGEKVVDTLCIGCHGAGLDGGDSGPKLVGTTFLENWDGQSVAALVDWLREFMPEDAPGTLSLQDATAVVAYILQVNKMPTGKQDLSSDPDTLARVTIVASKP